MFGGEQRAIRMDADLLSAFITSPTGTSEQAGLHDRQWLIGDMSPAMLEGSSRGLAVEAVGQPNFGPFATDEGRYYAPAFQQQIDSLFCTRLVPGTCEDPITGTQYFASGSCAHIDPFFKQNDDRAMLVMFGTAQVVQNARCAVSSALASGYTVFLLRPPMPLWFYTDSKHINFILDQAERAAPSAIFITDDSTLTLNAASGKIPHSVAHYKGFPLLDGPAMRALAESVTHKAKVMRQSSAPNRKVKLIVTTSAGPEMFNQTMLRLATNHAVVAAYPTFIRQRAAVRCIVSSFFHMHHGLVFPQESDAQVDVNNMWEALWECAYHTTVDWFVSFLCKAVVLIKDSEPEHNGNAAALYTANNLLRTVRTRRIIIREGGNLGRITGHYTLLPGYQALNSANAQCARFFAEVSRNDDRFASSFHAHEESLTQEPSAPLTSLPFTQQQRQSPLREVANPPPTRRSTSIHLVSSAPNLRQPVPELIAPTLQQQVPGTEVNDFEEGELTAGEIERAESRDLADIHNKRVETREKRREDAERARLTQSADQETDLMIAEFDTLHSAPRFPQFSTEKLNAISRFHPRVARMVKEGICPFPENELEYNSVLRNALSQEEAERQQADAASSQQPPPPIEKDEAECPTSPRSIVPAPSPPRNLPVQKTKQPIPLSLFKQSDDRKRNFTALSQLAAVFGDGKTKSVEKTPDSTSENKKLEASEPSQPAKSRPRGLFGKRFRIVIK